MTTDQDEPTMDMALVIKALREALELAESLDGAELDERQSWSPGRLRDERLAKSRTLQVLAHRCQVAEALTMNEYWIARGVNDILGLNDEQ